MLLLCLMYLITYIDRVNVRTAAPLIRKELGSRNTQLGIVFSAFALSVCCCFRSSAAGSGIASAPGRTLTCAALVWAAATIFTGLAGGLIALFVVRLLLGIGEGATFPIATRAMRTGRRPDRRGFAQGVTHAFARLGNAMTPPLVAG